MNSTGIKYILHNFTDNLHLNIPFYTQTHLPHFGTYLEPTHTYTHTHTPVRSSWRRSHIPAGEREEKC